MAELKANWQSFVTLMGKSAEHASRGFELLLKRNDFDAFFDAIASEGIFDPENNPAPVPVKAEGAVRIPYWPALDYLTACARRSDERGDPELAGKVMEVVRAVSIAREPDGSVRDNFHTFRKFAVILGLLPTSAVGTTDIELVRGWLESPLDHDMVANALDEGALKRFLHSDHPEDWKKAVQLLDYCTAVRWIPKKRPSGLDDEEPETVVDGHWLKELVNNHSLQFGRRIGFGAAKVLEGRVRDLFGRGGRGEWSHVYRSAVGTDGQNHRGRNAENSLVEALRDVLLGWCDADLSEARKFVEGLLRSDVEMLRRIGIYVMSERWQELQGLYHDAVKPAFFDTGHLHELYGLLRDRFDQLADEDKAATIKAIRDLPALEGDDAEDMRERIQQRWLSAISGTSYAPAAAWLAKLDAEHGPHPKHPDYHAFIETRWGPGPSPYGVEELVAFAQDGSLVEKLNAFVPSDEWRGPTRNALAETLERAISTAPDAFLRALPKFTEAARPYQHSVLSGFRRLWKESKDQPQPIDWDSAWSRLFDLFEQLLGDPAFWVTPAQAAGDFTPAWIASVIADLLQDGTHDDEHSYPASLLPRGGLLIEILIERADAVDQPDDDPMTQAINSPKGRSIEALYNHTLRRCRLADKESGSHAAVWTDARKTFDRELEKCANGNYEFSTLAGAYLANLEYLDADWLNANIAKIFPAAFPANLVCAISGLAYASANRRTYQMLRDSEVMDAALRLEFKGRHEREKLMERLALAYLWGDESLDSPRLAYLFESARADDFEFMNTLFSSVREKEMEEAHVARVVAYWDRCVEWAKTLPEPPAKLLSSLSTLTAYMATAAGKNRGLLLAVAPHVHVHHNAYEFLEQLNRLVETSPAEVNAVLGRFIETHEPFYDYEDRMQTLIGRLAELDFRSDALKYCERLRVLPGIADLFFKLTASSLGE